MPDPVKILERKLALIESAPLAFEEGVLTAQREIFEDLINLISKLEKKGDAFTNSATNRAAVDRIIERATNLLMEGPYAEALTNYLVNLQSSVLLSDSYFKAITDFEQKAFYRETIKKAIAQVTDLFDKDAIGQVFINPLKTLLSTQVDLGASFGDTVKTLRNFIEGNPQLDVEGKLSRYVKQNARDAFAQTDRLYLQIVTKDIGLAWYRYSGALIADSREFCIHRAGNYYHEDEIRDWASLNWQGKNPNTNRDNIFILLGGFNCIHTLDPVLEDVVPQADRDRVK